MQRNVWGIAILAWLLLLLGGIRSASSAFISKTSFSNTDVVFHQATTITHPPSLLLAAHPPRRLRRRPWASLLRLDESDQQLIEELQKALQRAGFMVETENSSFSAVKHGKSFTYQFSKATGMLKLLSSPSVDDGESLEGNFEAPRWIPIVSNFENVLVANGWSFLDADDNDPVSAFDVDAANQEGLYQPKWGSNDQAGFVGNEQTSLLSSLGFRLNKLSSEQVQQLANELRNPLSRSVLLDGTTDPPQSKTTRNGFKFTGSTGQADIEKGIFTCAIGGLPLFTTIDLLPTTASSGWLSFSQPVADDHVVLVQPETGSTDQRIEVICARTGCHLGHYFGKGNGFCINTSALNFTPVKGNQDSRFLRGPESWRKLEIRQGDDTQTPSISLLKQVLESKLESQETVVLGAGCFWHVESALRRLPGVISTEVGYAGGTTSFPTYADVCEKVTGHAEVVKVTFDHQVLNPRILIDCFLALHDPTKVRAHGKHSAGTGQYRSCIFVTNSQMEQAAHEAIQDCSAQLGKDLSTEIRRMEEDAPHLFWRAEDYHQRHDERLRGLPDSDVCTLSALEGLLLYGKRSHSVIGSAETIATTTANSL